MGGAAPRRDDPGGSRGHRLPRFRRPLHLDRPLWHENEMKLSSAAFDAIREHGAEGYSNEICGILVGPPGKTIATEAMRARKTVVERSRDRYEMDPRDQIRIER